MSLMDRVRSGFDKAKDGISDLAETTKIKYEVNKLNDRKDELLREIGRQIYTLRAQGRVVQEVEAPCKEVEGLEQEIKRKGEEIARINTESRAGSKAV